MIFDAYAQFEESVISSKMEEMDQQTSDEGTFSALITSENKALLQ